MYEQCFMNETLIKYGLSAQVWTTPVHTNFILILLHTKLMLMLQQVLMLQQLPNKVGGGAKKLKSASFISNKLY